MAEAPGGIDFAGRTSVSMALVMPPPRTMSTLAISMIESASGSIPVVSMSMTRITLGSSYPRGAPSTPTLAGAPQSGTGDARLSGALDQVVATSEHLVDATPAAHVVALEPCRLEAA